MTPATTLANIFRAKGRIEIEKGTLVLDWDGDPPTDIVAAIREHKAELLALLTPPPYWPSPVPPLDPRDRPADACRFCGERIDWRLSAVVFADELGAHWACYTEAVGVRKRSRSS